MEKYDVLFVSLTQTQRYTDFIRKFSNLVGLNYPSPWAAPLFTRLKTFGFPRAEPRFVTVEKLRKLEKVNAKMLYNV